MRPPNGEQFRAGLVLAAIGLLAVLLCAGCTSVTGGQAATSSRALKITSSVDGEVTLEDNREHAATTQPSAVGFGRLSIGESAAGSLGEVSMTAAKRNWALGVTIGLLYLALAAGCWLLGMRVRAIILAVAGCLGFFYPLPMLLLGVLLLGFILYRHSAVVRQLVGGVDSALATLPAAAADAARQALGVKQDESTKAVVRAARGKM